jgi:hypothetical protein
MKAELSFWFVIGIAVSAQSAVAQSGEPINTERPSFSASPFVLSPGAWQIETGLQYVDDDSGADYSLLVLPQALLRYGMSDEVELQLSLPSLLWLDAGNNNDSGMSDAAFGVKIRMTDDIASTSVAFLAGVSLPTGDDEFTSDSFDPRIGAAWAHSRYFGTATITRADGDYTFENGVGVTFALRNATSAFAEWQATFPDGGGSIHRLNGGWLWSPKNSMQWDVNASLGLNDRAPDFSIGGGFSYRF